jgi:beta-glucosidase
MNRSDFLKLAGAGTALMYSGSLFSKAIQADPELSKELFGNQFYWGVSTAAHQIEGAWNVDGKGENIWDRFSAKKGKIRDHSSGQVACDFYHSYESDIDLLKSLNFKDFRFSLSWSRLMPEGTGRVNEKGVDFYNRVIDKCLSAGIEPWITLYHWDLPQPLEDKGGWTNRDVVLWFSEFTELCVKRFGDRVRHWIVLNEPAAFTSLGYLIGMHAPGHRGIQKFLASVHHAMLCQAEGGRIIRRNLSNAHIGTALSCSWVEPKKQQPRFDRAATRTDVILNRLFIEPTLGMGYPKKDLPFLEKMERYIQPGDEEKLKFEFDFIGLQNYFRVVSKPSIIPYIRSIQAKPDKKKAELTQMGWEVWPEGIYKSIKQYAKYPIKEIIITENGAAFPDVLDGERIHDVQRMNFFKEYLKSVLKAKSEGVNVTGYFLWTFLDNFEWSYGYKPRFGIVYTDFYTQKRFVKDSGLWFREFLK